MSAGAPLPVAFFHPDSGTVRFWVNLPDGGQMGATISRETLHHRFNTGLGASEAMAAYESHRTLIDEAVRLRASRGSIEPVMLRESDLPAPPRR